MSELAGFTRTTFLYEGVEHPVFRRGKGPGVVVVAEIPGITPQVRSFAERVAEAGFTVYLPKLFGVPNRPLNARSTLSAIAQICVSREFKLLAGRDSSPVTDWLRALCRHVFAECGGKGVGAIGMCLTGNFALSMMVDPVVMAPVLCQPSLPLPISKEHRAGLHISDEDLATVKARDVPVLGLRFTEDPLCRRERFQHLRDELGERFEGIEIDSSRGNAHGIKRTAHSVLTNDLVDKQGHPTRKALDRVLAFFKERLVTEESLAKMPAAD